MANDLGVWTADDCALVLIDYQNEMFEVIRSETSAELVELHVRLLAKMAKAFGVPIVLSTVGVGFGFNGPTHPSVLSELDGVEPIDRASMSAFEDGRFRAAVEATGRRLRRSRWPLASCAPHRHRPAGARRGGSDHGARRHHRAVPRLGRAASRAGPRRHLLVLQ
ncbi:MAG TPA: isochorismatase family protein [Jatrophihabitantaceae bacterium]|jgi:hypothetical protein